ncbi:MAG: class I SAM-dependent methyltransferase [Candidatus Dadabacteria bacterium]|nr:MAG: class I SAM-dependent methyltransferase [Candidatus Dadabacteria bacterium]
MERLLRVLGVGRWVREFLENVGGSDGPQRILDVGCGGGWVFDEIARAKPEATLVGLDRSVSVLRLARARRRPARVRWLLGDAAGLPVRSHSVDVVISTMTLHHLDLDGAALFFRECDRVAKLGWYACDLRRNPLTRFLVRLGVRLSTRNPVSLHDGPASAREAFSWKQWTRLAREAGGARVRLRRRGCIAAEVRKGG